MASWNKVTQISVSYTENIYTKKDDGTTEKATKDVTENVTILGNTTAVHFFGETWDKWIDLNKDGTTTIDAGTTTVRELQADGTYQFNSKTREKYDRAKPISQKRIGAGKKVVLYTGLYGKKSNNGDVWRPKTVTFQFPAWLKVRDILDAIRTLCNNKIKDTGVPSAEELHPYCRINGVRYPIMTSAAASAAPKVNPAEDAAIDQANDSSEKSTRKNA